jgi:ABC-type phosphate transport system substrate-binding protein
MRSGRTAWCSSAVLVFLLGCVFLQSAAAQVSEGHDASSDVAVIVHRDNPINNLSLSELRRIYMGERQYWRPDLPVAVLIRTPGSREREVVLREIFKMNEAQYKQFWVAKIMRAESTSSPVEIFSNGMTKEGVASLAGGIGCVSASDVRSGVKVLRINGHLPGEAAYPLR